MGAELTFLSPVHTACACSSDMSALANTNGDVAAALEAEPGTAEGNVLEDDDAAANVAEDEHLYPESLRRRL